MKVAGGQRWPTRTRVYLLVTAAARTGSRGRGVSGLILQFIIERSQLRSLAGSMLQRALEDPVRKPGIARKQRAMEIRPERVAHTHALEAALAVVPEPRDDASERLCALVEPRHPGVILEPGQRPAHAGLELARQKAVTDHPALSGNRLVRKETRAG